MDHLTKGEVDENKAFAVEHNGINLVPDSQRNGSPRDLFWIWTGANLVLTYIIVGYLVQSMGLSPAQMWGVVLAGNLAFLLVGYGGIPGARAGTVTLVISRAAFGPKGNLTPSFLSWLTVVGWEAVNLALGAFALFSLFDLAGISLGTTGKAIALVALAALTFGVAILGHATILFMQRIFTWGLGLAVIGLVPQVWSAPMLATGSAPGGAGIVEICIAFGLVAALPISYANYPADYTRYLPRATRGGEITFWTFLGATLPAAGLTALGYYASRVADLADPVGGFAPILSNWYFAIFVVVVLGGTITNNFLNTYSSGMSLLALGLRLSRPSAILVDAALATTAAAYAIFFHDFTSTFMAFLSLMVIWLAPWTAIYVTDIWLRKSRYKGEDLLAPHGGSYGYIQGWHVPGAAALVAGSVAALLCTSTDLFRSPFAEHVLGGADISIEAGFIVAALVYLVLAGRAVRSADNG